MRGAGRTIRGVASSQDLQAILGLCLAAALLILAGCAEDPTIPLRRQLIESQDQLAKTREENLQLQQTLRQRDDQVQTLQALGAGKRLEKLFYVKRVQLGTYTGGIDMDSRPGDDGVKVFVEPIDQYGSTIKAAGEVTVQLYDLAAPPAENLLATGRWTVDQLQGRWTNGFLTQYYICECAWGPNVPRHNQITVRVEFTDYLTGNKFTDQKVVQVALPPPTTQPVSGPASAPSSALPSAPASSPTTKAGP